MIYLWGKNQSVILGQMFAAEAFGCDCRKQREATGEWAKQQTNVDEEQGFPTVGAEL